MRIGLVGEDPNDKLAIRNLLTQKYKSKATFLSLGRNFKGHHLDTPKFKKTIVFEINEKKCDLIIFIRDLDGFKSEVRKYREKQTWFTSLQKETNKTCLFLLNIWELEALIISDIEVFNKVYSTKYKGKGDPSTIKQPKEELKKVARKHGKEFLESDCPELFSKLRFEKVCRCSYFKHFINELNSHLSVN